MIPQISGTTRVELSAITLKLLSPTQPQDALEIFQKLKGAIREEATRIIREEASRVTGIPLDKISLPDLKPTKELDYDKTLEVLETLVRQGRAKKLVSPKGEFEYVQNQ